VDFKDKLNNKYFFSFAQSASTPCINLCNETHFILLTSSPAEYALNLKKETEAGLAALLSSEAAVFLSHHLIATIIVSSTCNTPLVSWQTLAKP
jgi:hypothetical protein